MTMKLKNSYEIFDALTVDSQKIALADGIAHERLYIGDYSIDYTLHEGQDDEGIFTQIIAAKSSSGKDERKGIRFDSKLYLDLIGKNCRFFVPSLRYTTPKKTQTRERFEYMETRLPGIIAGTYDIESGVMHALQKISPAKINTRPERIPGQKVFCHKTDVTSIGYEVGNDEVCLLFGFPYREGDKSVALNANEDAICAFYPLDGNDFTIVNEYRLLQLNAKTFTEGVYQAFHSLADAYAKRGIACVANPFTAKDAVSYRLASLANTYGEFGTDGAGFFFHFDPEKGYGSLPSGFSTSFNTIPHTSYTHILEYGFTGREINAAYMLAKHGWDQWLEKSEKVTDFFLKKCMRENGWLFSLYDLDTEAPFYSCGDPDAPKMHYVSRKHEKGNYLRTMCEPMNDVLDMYELYLLHGIRHDNWLKEVKKFADFLVRIQNEDGSWYRAYQPNGNMADIGGDDNLPESEKMKGWKAATAIPMPFITHLCKTLQKEGAEFNPYLQMLKRAGEYVLSTSCREEHYQGGTLDNPNVVDKEAAQYAMAGLYSLYTLTNKEKDLEGALGAAKSFVTWNFIWNSPTVPGTILHQKRFMTKGLGAINSIWGGGVVDIYSGFHIRELYEIGRACKEPFLCEMAGWTSSAMSQIMSYPEDLMGFYDIGMQPEGFGICPAGADEGQIHTGDIWGSLGWIYSSGSYGLERYLETVQGSGK